jgi:plasmid stabilization system protein ParE
MPHMHDDLEIIWHPAAVSEMLSIREYYEENVSVKAADGKIERIHEVIDHLMTFPYLGREVNFESVEGLDLRVLVIDEYLCIYTLEPDGINIYYLVSSRTDYIRNLKMKPNN